MPERARQSLLARKKGIPRKDRVTVEVRVGFIRLPLQEELDRAENSMVRPSCLGFPVATKTSQAHLGTNLRSWARLGN